MEPVLTTKISKGLQDESDTIWIVTRLMRERGDKKKTKFWCTNVFDLLDFLHNRLKEDASLV